MKNFNSKIIVALIFTVIISGLCGLGYNLSQKKAIDNNIDSFGKVHYNNGSIGSVQTDTSDATLIIERNTGRKYLAITNAGSEAVYIWPRNYTGTTTATEGVNKNGGIYLAGSGGSYEVFDNEFLWIGDIWASTTSAPITITYVEK